MGSVSENEPDNISEYVDILTFCGLVLSYSSVWNFPAETMANGGAFFVIIYLLATFTCLFPILHLELFVGQRHQSGVCRVYRSYGRAYEGFGAAVCILTFLTSQYSMMDSYATVVHFGILSFHNEPKDLVSCSSKRYSGATSCVSLLEHTECQRSVEIVSGRRLTSHYYTYDYRSELCTDVRYGDYSPYNVSLYQHKSRFFDSVSEIYLKFIREGNSRNIYVQRLWIYLPLFCMFAILCLLRVTDVRRLIAVIYVMFAVSFISSVVAFVTLTEFGTVTSILWSASTPESLLILKTYARAVRLAFNSGGLAVCGVMSAASFRSKSKNSYRLATIMVFSNIATSFLSLLATLSICGTLADNSYQRTFSPRRNPNIFVIGMVTEAVITKTNNTFWVVVFTFAYLITKITPFFAPIMVAAAITRDLCYSSHRWSRRVGVMGSVCIIGFVVSVFRSIVPAKVYVNQLLPDVQSTYEVVIPIAMLVIFIVIYGRFFSRQVTNSVVITKYISFVYKNLINR
ncbi:unnamed protein product [Cylicocyclus nassatus]|uniref:Uncharacterized protein n=1 Tax=Cylicocyclus nassatus TaxID=53992 RepID=A0AA36GY87_CYLNA|nr:unnamed protein product [Cylicocyclus nassatus]